MAIQPKDVKREEDGNWQHPDLPDWPESTATTEMDDWLYEQRIRSKVIHLNAETSDQEIDLWLSGQTESLQGRSRRELAQGFFALSIYRGDGGTFIWLGIFY